MAPINTIGKDNICPIVNQPNAINPYCGSGWRKHSPIIRATPYASKNRAETANRGRGLAENHHITMNNTTPSKKNSYNCEGCRGSGPAAGKIMPQGTVV